MFEHFDARSRDVMVLAQQQARELGHNYLGTEHLLFGLADAGGTVATVLAQRGCGPDDITAEITDLIGAGRPSARRPEVLLATLGIDLDEVRRRVEVTFGPDAITRATRTTHPRRRWWPGQRWWPGCQEGRPRLDTVLGARWLRLAPRVKEVLDIAVRRSKPHQVTPEQLMLAILEEGQGVACQILSRRGVDLTEFGTALQHDSG
jgi:ATP-dependent Clp protease ATP-binding subunit ClpA